jgi:hypothetical protein
MASRKTFEMSYYNTYYFANIIHSVVMHPFGYLRNIDEFYQTGLSIPAKFSKDSNLHEFIRFIIDGIFNETLQKECQEIDEKGLMAHPTKIKPFWINNALREHGFEHISFQEWLEDSPYKDGFPDDAAYSYLNDFLHDLYQDLLKKLAVEVFYILFMNREFLLEFNGLISVHIEGIEVDENDPYVAVMLKRDGVLYRADIPNWVKDAVFFRDRGHCVFCNTNLTNLITRLTVRNFDHMVPLNLSGANDVSNIQLTCETCNLAKSGTISETSKTYELWYKD